MRLPSLPPRLRQLLAGGSLLVLGTPVLGIAVPAHTAGSSLVLAEGTVLAGESVSAIYSTDEPSATNWIGLYRAEAGQPDDTFGVAVRAYASEPDGTVELVTPTDLEPGDYLVHFLANDGYAPLAPAQPVTIADADQEPAALASPMPFTPEEEPVAISDLPPASEQTGPSQELRVLTWNIYHGGRDDGSDDLDNRAAVAEYVASLAPDVFLAIETYGAAETILATLNANADGRVYAGMRITQAANDNLWIFTHLPIVETFAAPVGLGVSDFNVGGVRVRLDNDREVSLFNAWSAYTDPWIGDLIEQNALDVLAGRAPRHDEAAVLAADRVQTETVAELATYVAQHSAPGSPAILGGDLNTVVSDDWDARFAACASHAGLSYPLVATIPLLGLGFADDLRAVHPDACAAPGGTWSPRLETVTPQRIDVTFSRGDDVAVLDADTLDGAEGDGTYLSDHAAVLTDYRVGPLVAPEPELEPEPVDPIALPGGVDGATSPVEVTPVDAGADGSQRSLPVTGGSSTTAIAGLALALALVGAVLVRWSRTRVVCATTG